MENHQLILGKMKEHELKNGKNLILRKAEEKDAAALLKHMNQCGKETDFLGFGKEGIDMDEQKEQEYIKAFTPKNFMILALIDNEIIGSCSISCRESRIRFIHKGELGICVQEKAWGLGVGEKMMTYTLELAKDAGLNKIGLDTRTDNEKAINLYKKLGFEIEGNVKNSTLIDGIYYNSYVMGKDL